MYNRDANITYVGIYVMIFQSHRKVSPWLAERYLITIADAIFPLKPELAYSKKD